jgi:hypothetical protein
MALLDELPKEVEASKFSEFLESVKTNFPADQFPELFIHYQEIDQKFLVLAIGKSNECAKQMVKAFSKNPSLKAKRGTSLMLRAPRTKFLLRRAILCR